MTRETDDVLEGRGLSKSYGAVRAVGAVDLTVRRSEIVGLAGPNGSGKTTVINMLSGVVPLSGGTIKVGGNELTGQGARTFARAGIARTFQTVRLFERFSVWENVEVSARAWHHRCDDGGVRGLIDRLGLTADSHRLVSDLPYGTRRRVTIARALAARPTFLLLDEPAAGMDEDETRDLAHLIREVHEDPDFAVGVLIVEHDMGMMLTLCDRLVVLVEGAVLANDIPSHVVVDRNVVDAFLGVQ